MTKAEIQLSRTVAGDLFDAIDQALELECIDVARDTLGQLRVVVDEAFVQMIGAGVPEGRSL